MVDRSSIVMSSTSSSSNNNQGGGKGGPPNLLPPDFVPGKWDVICQRGKECYEHGKRFSKWNSCVLYVFYGDH